MSLGAGGKGEDGKAALRALAHPVRLQIMSLLAGAGLTAAEVARELGLTHANASYHLRNLLSGGLIVMAGEERIRGGVAKRYGTRPEPARRPLPDEQLRAEFAAAAHELIRRSSGARFAELRSLIGDGDFWIEPDVWLAIRERIAEAVDDLHRAARPPNTPGTVRTSTTVAMFQLRADEVAE